MVRRAGHRADPAGHSRMAGCGGRYHREHHRDRCGSACRRHIADHPRSHDQGVAWIRLRLAIRPALFCRRPAHHERTGARCRVADASAHGSDRRERDRAHRPCTPASGRPRLGSGFPKWSLQRGCGRSDLHELALVRTVGARVLSSPSSCWCKVRVGFTSELPCAPLGRLVDDRPRASRRSQSCTC